jgi:hypothetical protein
MAMILPVLVAIAVIIVFVIAVRWIRAKRMENVSHSV